MTRFACLVLACLLAPALSAAETLPWSNMATVGQARLKVLFWTIYEATLYVGDQNGNVNNRPVAPLFTWPDSAPFALELEYQRDFQATALVEETRRQWQAMGVAAPAEWLEQLQAILPGVKKGDSITLHVDAAGISTFYVNSRAAGTINDPEFSRQFSAIWLSAQTTHPAMRRQLIGEDK
ncbi:MAG: chalcone isomerase family protein [Pseudohongiellaceae bacterium]|jgi:hypothetical protein